MTITDELVWQRRNKDEQNWRARNAADDATYVAYIIDSYGTTQIYGVLHPDTDTDGSGRRLLYSSIAGVGSIADAKDAAQEHHYTACRAQRWATYMLTHEPPALAPCCEGGPQWGHAWHCPNCPD